MHLLLIFLQGFLRDPFIHEKNHALRGPKTQNNFRRCICLKARVPAAPISASCRTFCMPVSRPILPADQTMFPRKFFLLIFSEKNYTKTINHIKIFYWIRRVERYNFLMPTINCRKKMKSLMLMASLSLIALRIDNNRLHPHYVRSRPSSLICTSLSCGIWHRLLLLLL